MNLEHQIGDTLQRLICAETGDDVVNGADMHVEGRNQIGK